LKILPGRTFVELFSEIPDSLIPRLWEIQMTNKLKVLIWTNMPTHHQADFFDALRDAGIDLAVHYYDSMDENRIKQGWHVYEELPRGEHFVCSLKEAFEVCPDWRERTHIVTGYRAGILRELVKILVHMRVAWVHWSEPAHKGLRWWATYPIKRWYATKVNYSARTACAIGVLAEKDFIAWGIKPDKIRFLPYAANGISISNELDQQIAEFASKTELSFLYLGSLSKRKGTDILLSAFAELVVQNPKAGLILVGRDSNDFDYPRMAERLGIAGQVLFRGTVQSDLIGHVLSCAQVLVLPSRFDGWGMVINEAASAGKAIIATSSCGASYHLIEEGRNGYMIQSGNVKALADRMGIYCKNPELSRKHGDHSKMIFSDFTPERNAKRFIEILTEC
jgi:glycosyltransferase involved in cell wall biosynthesis